MHNLYRRRYSEALAKGYTYGKLPEDVKEDMDSSKCPFLKEQSITPISQFDMAVVQVGFIAPLFYWNCLHKNMFKEQELRS